MSVNPDDPRVIRTRQQLVQAFNELVGEKRNFYSISVHDIAMQAAVNRTTFYAHFQDKYDFLEYWKTEKFQIFVNGRLPEDVSFNAKNLRILIQTIFDFLLQARQHSTPGDKQFETIFENAIHKKLHRLLLKWLHEANTHGHSRDKVETKALVVSWGIFGSALQWSRNPQNRSVEWMVEEIMEVIGADLASFI
ncbi:MULTISPECIES: TetR/AcrR family transcriptional regulator [Paenibacillus]|uniref:TetR/AcrR family transcriptional regulator n=1 Tax=Paenibacillus TaxID=44249 RepID=UPI0022B85B5B|nr:TetR family transcriptional regulator [Paenibacillus caseinilyticus]MCZ8524054.1 TetR family transcriptional regulator [Paenibacillus caseinilyticus]